MSKDIPPSMSGKSVRRGAILSVIMGWKTRKVVSKSKDRITFITDSKNNFQEVQ
eukprot:UN24790